MSDNEAYRIFFAIFGQNSNKEDNMQDDVIVHRGKSLIIGSINDIKKTIEHIEKHVKNNDMDMAKTCATNLEEQSKDLYMAILGGFDLE